MEIELWILSFAAFALFVAAVAYRDQLGKWWRPALGVLIAFAGFILGRGWNRPSEESPQKPPKPPEDETKPYNPEDSIDEILDEHEAPTGEPGDDADLSSNNPGDWKF